MRFRPTHHSYISKITLETNSLATEYSDTMSKVLDERLRKFKDDLVESIHVDISADITKYAL